MGKCLVKFPSNLTFWKIAIYNEFENNKNFITARQLAQKCIRLNANELNAYIDYFVFEIKFAEMLMERKHILSKGNTNEDGKKLKIVNEIIKSDDTNNEDMNDNDNDMKDDNNQIAQLAIPKLIWKQALNALANSKVYQLLEIHFSFLNALEKYAVNKYLQIELLEKEIINEIITSSNTNPSTNVDKSITMIDIQLRITQCKLQRIKRILNDKDNNNKQDTFISNILTEYKSNLLTNDNKLYFNYIVSHLLNFICDEVITNENNDNENENEHSLLNTLIPKVKPFIQHTELTNIHNNNINLLLSLTSPKLIHLNIIEGTEIKSILFTLLNNALLSETKGTLINKIFTVFINTKYILNTSDNNNNNESSILDQLLTINMKKTKTNLNSISAYIENICTLIGEEITYYLYPQKSIEYFDLLYKQIHNINDIEFDVYTVLYKSMLMLIINKIIECDNIALSKTHYESAIVYLKRNMSNNLVNFKHVLKLIQSSAHHQENEKANYEWIIYI